jgi:tRNA 2-thiouridine synthesizing protein E
MAYEFDGKTIETDKNGYLVNLEDWSEGLATHIAQQEEGVGELTDKHWDVIKYLRDEYLNNAGNQPNMRNIAKALAKVWGQKKVESKEVYDLFPAGPTKQAGKIAGLPEDKRKGGY